jgi:hypothetical protein
MGTLLSIGNEQDGACRSSARQMEWKGKGKDRLVRALSSPTSRAMPQP